MGEKHLPAGLGHRGLGPQDGPLPYSMPLISTSLSNKEAPTFCCMNWDAYRHTYVAGLGTHMLLQGCARRARAPNPCSFLNAQSIPPFPQLILFPRYSCRHAASKDTYQSSS